MPTLVAGSLIQLRPEDLRDAGLEINVGGQALGSLLPLVAAVLGGVVEQRSELRARSQRVTILAMIAMNQRCVSKVLSDH